MSAGVREDGRVTLISGNDMGILMLDYLCRHQKQKTGLPPVVIKTIVTTEMATALCEKYHLELKNVLTGFKFIGEQIALLERSGQKDRFLFGFEESCGYLSGTDVRDKDAVNAAVLLCDMAADLKSEGLTLLDRLAQLRAEFGIYAQRLLTYEYTGEDGSVTMRNIMAGLRAPLSSFESISLQNASRIDYLNDETGLPKSDVLLFRLNDTDRLIVRPSGTEPKMKAYLFAGSDTMASAEKKLDELEALVQQICGQKA